MTENEPETKTVPEEARRCGFVALIGAPNSGKSTLTNALVGTKVSIVTHKAQTTRGPVRGLALVDDAQIILVDTPGIFQPKRRLDRAMAQAAWDRAGDADIVALVIDAKRGLDAKVTPLIEHLPVRIQPIPFRFSYRLGNGQYVGGWFVLHWGNYCDRSFLRRSKPRWWILRFLWSDHIRRYSILPRIV